LRAITGGDAGNEFRISDCSRVDGDFVGSAVKHSRGIVERAYASANSEGNEELIGGAAHRVQ